MPVRSLCVPEDLVAGATTATTSIQSALLRVKPSPRRGTTVVGTHRARNLRSVTGTFDACDRVQYTD